MKCILLIIDPQNDFHAGGSLAVKGADEDALRIAQMIRENWHSIDEIYVTMDCHQVLHCVVLLCYSHIISLVIYLDFVITVTAHTHRTCSVLGGRGWTASSALHDDHV